MCVVHGWKEPRHNVTAPRLHKSWSWGTFPLKGLIFVGRFAGGSVQGAGFDYQGFPAGLRPPVSLALAKPGSGIPATDALPGGCLY
jgi:hypothetical protein